MNVDAYLRVVRNQRAILAVALILGVLGALTAHFLQPDRFTSRLQFFVSAQASPTQSSAYQGVQLSQERVESYTALLETARVADDVARRLGQPGPPSDVQQEISATSSPNSVVINVSVTDPSPAQATRIANTVGEVFPQLIEEIERPPDSAEPSPIVVRVVEPAEAPLQPDSAGLVSAVLVGLLGGLVVGLGIGFARSAFDMRIHDSAHLSTVSGLPVLGVLAVDPAVAEGGLTVVSGAQTPRSEAMRHLRTSLQFVDVDRPPRAIAVTSAAPGEGKSSTVVDLAAAFALRAQRVVVVDADLRRPAAAARLRLEEAVGFTSVVAGTSTLDDALQRHGGGGFDVLASGPPPPNPSELIGSRPAGNLLRSLRERYDLVLIDTPPLLVTDAATLAPHVDGVVVVCRAGRTTTAQLLRATDAIRAVSGHLLGAILTMAPVAGPRGEEQYTTYYQRVDDSSPDPRPRGRRPTNRHESRRG